jgi:hypothetical protein
MIGYQLAQGTGHIPKDTRGRIAVKAFVDGTLTDAAGSVTVTVIDEGGTTIINAQTATKESTGLYYYDIGIANTADVNKLYAVWTGTWETVTQKLRTTHEVIGFPIFSEASARSFDVSQLASATDYTDEAILDERQKITDLLEQWTGVSWVSRYNRVKLEGEGDRIISPPSFHITKILSCTVLGESIATSNFEIDNNAGFIHRTDGFFEKPTSAFPLPVVIEYEYGWEYIRNGVDRIGLKLLVDRIVSSNIPDRATSFNDELGNIALVTQGGGLKNPTRIPEVNQWIEENSEKVFGV